MIEPQQPAEGELVNNPYKDKPVEEPCGDCWNEAFNEGSEAQLAHMIQQGYRKLPSEDELALWLCDHLNCTSRELAQELLKLLNGCEILEVLAEFDRLTVRNVNLQTCLDTICEPIRTDGDIDYIKRTVIPLLYEQCKTISAQTLERVLAYLDSQEPSEKPRCENKYCENGKILLWGEGYDCPICNPQKPSEKPKNDLHFCDASRRWMDGDKANCTICNPRCEHSDDSGVFWEGREADCPICSPKSKPPSTQCPECKGAEDSLFKWLYSASICWRTMG